jgi:hypothetical protein
MCLAVAVMMLAPAIARAALIPECEAHDQLTRMPVEWVAPTPPPPSADSCDAGVGLTMEGDRPAQLVAAPHPDELGDTRLAPMCDERGACVVAPPRIHPVADDRIEAGTRCGWDSSGPLVAPGPRHSPDALTSPMLAQHAVLDALAMVPPAPSELAAPFPRPSGGPRIGYARGIDHPPR